MKMKSVLALLFAAMVMVSVVACSEEKSDYDKGVEDGKAMCDCAKAAGQDEEALAACEARLDESKMSAEDAEEPTEYEMGVIAGAIGCLE